MREMMSYQEWRKYRRRKRRAIISGGFLIVVGIIGFSLLFLQKVSPGFISNSVRSRFSYTDACNTSKSSEEVSGNLTIDKQYLTPSSYSRPQDPLKKVNSVVIHYTANPGSTAQQNRDYFEGLSKSKITSASSHYVIGTEGEIIQCLPLTEISYASNYRNSDTVSIECCHPDKTGKFTKKTYASLIYLTAELCLKYNLAKDGIIRHYDITGKLCPLYYVKHEDAWEKLKDDVMKRVEGLKSSDKKK
jgi:N-acetylmuramoyl-L-alanine amidase